jgi:membrane-associated protein
MVAPIWDALGGPGVDAHALHSLVLAALLGNPIVGPASPLSAQFWLTSLGAFGVLLVVFAETGLLLGVFLPGDSLLFTAGVVCSAHLRLGPEVSPGLSLPWVLAAAAVGALTGAQVGFVVGRRGGRALLARTRNRHVRSGLARAEALLTRYGYGKAILLGRFIPVVRTVINPVAGVLAVPNRVFVRWQVLGGLVWSVGITLAGYALGSSIPDVDRYLLPAIAVVIAVSLLPVGWELVRARRLSHTHITITINTTINTDINTGVGAAARSATSVNSRRPVR